MLNSKMEEFIFQRRAQILKESICPHRFYREPNKWTNYKAEREVTTQRKPMKQTKQRGKATNTI